MNNTPENRSNLPIGPERFGANDERIALAIEVTRIFIEQQDISKFSIEGAASMARHVQIAVAIFLGVPQEKLRLPTNEGLREFITFITGDGGQVGWLRHGGQEKSAEVAILPDETQQKIQMMQNPNNLVDPLTDLSVAETAGLAFMLAYARAKSGKRFVIQTSPNARASQVADIVAAVLNVQAIVKPELRCPEYPENLSPEQADYLYEYNGAVAWIEAEADLIFGHGAFSRVADNVRKLTSKMRKNTVVINITHTQQTNAADKLADADPKRLPELAARGFSQDEKGNLQSIVINFHQN